MAHWYFDEKMAAERMRETQRVADRALALGLHRQVEASGWQRIRMRIGERLVSLGQRLQQGDAERQSDLPSPSQCGLR